MSRMEAKVKSVLSGDTLILHNVRNPAQERTLSLAFVGAPRLRREGDEPGAFDSREFLRQQLVGKVVQFSVLYNVPNPSPRDYGNVLLPSGQSLLELTVSEGWVKLRDDAGKREESPQGIELLEKLQMLEARAKADGKGLWSSEVQKIETAQELQDSKAFVEEWKGKPIEAIVERILSGDRLIVRLKLSPTRHVQTLVLIAGIRAPATKRTNPSDNSEQAAEPYGTEAQSFVEQRLLQRDVKVKVLGTSPQGQLVGEVEHPVGNIAEFELKAGLARCVDHHSTLIGAEMGRLRQAERYARDNKLGLFHSVASTRSGASGEVEAIVSRVFSADTVYVRNKSGADKRVNLSSVRGPKPTDPAQSGFVQEAKEFLRKRAIGKHVKVVIDGKRPAQQGYDEREMATITLAGKNVGLLLVENGYASVIRHRMDDTDRSPIYDELLAAEEAAKSEGKGLWNPKPPKQAEYVDYSASLDQAKRQMTLFARQRRIPAVVDYVRSGSRFVVLVPRENARLTFVLSGISCPRAPRIVGDKAEGEGEPFGREAWDLANKRCLQRDVEIDVENIDKVGGFIGTLYVNRESFAKTLVEEGFASVHSYSAEKSGSGPELFAAEKKAKEGRKGLWHSWDPSQDAEEAGEDVTQTNGNHTNGDSAPTERRKDYRDVIITHIDRETCKLKLQQIGTGTSALQDLMKSFRSLHLSNTSAALDGPPKAGDYVSAKFTEDDTWYRARIRRNDRENKTSEVIYIDYGNTETIPWSRLRPLELTKFGVTKLKAQAVDAVLSFVQFGGSAEYIRDAAYAIEDIAAGKQLVANVDAADKDGTLYVTLFDPKRSEDVAQSINAEIVAEGVAMVPKKLKAWERSAADVLAGLKKREEEAKAERRGMWEYGDLTED